jgi:hypothetical protein
VLTIPFSTLKAGAPVLANPLNIGGATILTPGQFHYAFTNTVSDEESQALYDRYAVPCANRVFFEGAVENFVPHSPARVDVKADSTADSSCCGRLRSSRNGGLHESNFRLISQSPGITGYKEFPGRPHLTGAVEGWEAVADYALDWAVNPISTSKI